MIDSDGNPVIGPTEEELERLRDQYVEDDADSSETGVESERDATHECRACGFEVAEQTPFSTLELWCEHCDSMRFFERLEDGEDG